MTTINIRFTGVTERIISELISRGYAKTKAEALRFAIISTGRQLQIQETPAEEPPLSNAELLYIHDSIEDFNTGRHVLIPAKRGSKELIKSLNE